MDALSLFGFGRRKARRSKRSPGRRPKRGHGVRKLTKSQAYITVRNRRRRLHRGKNGGLYYRTKSGRHYVPSSVLRRKGHALSPSRKAHKKRRIRRRRGRKLKMTKKAIAARKAYRKRMRRTRRSRFGLW